MTAYLLDTTVIIDYLRGSSRTVDLLQRLAGEGSSLGSCLVNIIEVAAGTREVERSITDEFLDSLEYYDLTKDMTKKAAEFQRVYQSQGIPLSLSDVVIASVAISYGLTLLTDYPGRYPMPEVKLCSAYERA